MRIKNNWYFFINSILANFWQKLRKKKVAESRLLLCMTTLIYFLAEHSSPEKNSFARNNVGKKISSFFFFHERASAACSAARQGTERKKQPVILTHPRIAKKNMKSSGKSAANILDKQINTFLTIIFGSVLVINICSCHTHKSKGGFTSWKNNADSHAIGEFNWPNITQFWIKTICRSPS